MSNRPICTCCGREFSSASAIKRHLEALDRIAEKMRKEQEEK